MSDLVWFHAPDSPEELPVPVKVHVTDGERGIPDGQKYVKVPYGFYAEYVMRSMGYVRLEDVEVVR